MPQLQVALFHRHILAKSASERRLEIANAIAAAPDCDLLCFPYLASAPNFWTALDRPAGFSQAERHPLKTLQAIRTSLAARTMSAVISVYEVLGEGVFYAGLYAIDSTGASQRVAHQQHALNFEGHHERLFFQPGEKAPPALFSIGGVKLGFLLGGDLWVPEAARLLMLAGADLLIAQGGFPQDQHKNAALLAQCRSLENGLPLVLHDRIGPPHLYGELPGMQLETSGSDWSMLMIQDIEALSRSQSRDDAVMLRRPRLYSSLAKTWDMEQL